MERKTRPQGENAAAPDNILQHNNNNTLNSFCENKMDPVRLKVIASQLAVKIFLLQDPNLKHKLRSNKIHTEDIYLTS